MEDLADRIHAFLNREPPPEVGYVPGSLVEGLMVTYPADGRLDPGEELLGLCEAELAGAASANPGPAADYFGECLAIVRAIRQAERPCRTE